MSSTDENKPIGKPGQRNRKAEPRTRKPGQPGGLKPDQPQDTQEQTSAAVASANNVPIVAVAPSDVVPVSFQPIAPVSFQTIANAYGDYTRKSFEDMRSFVEKLTSVLSFDKVIEIQSEFAKQAFQTFVAESQKICELYGELARQTFKPLESFVTKATQTAR